MLVEHCSKNNNQKFQEAQELKACGGGFEIESYNDFVRVMETFQDPAALQAASDAAGKNHS